MHDDLYINHGDRANETYLRVFQDIFKKARQDDHYNMMIGISDVLPELADEQK